jgi:four helix bundle protein
MNRRLDHEKLEVYQASVAFIAWLEPILQKLPKSISVSDQLDRASTSIPLNIGEGNGKFTGADRCRYFDNARGSALESAAALDVLVAKGRCPEEVIWLRPALRFIKSDIGLSDATPAEAGTPYFCACG